MIPPSLKGALSSVGRTLKSGLNTPIRLGVGMTNDPAKKNFHQAWEIEFGGSILRDDDDAEARKLFTRTVKLLRAQFGLAGIFTSGSDPDGEYAYASWIKEVQPGGVQFVSVFMNWTDASLSVEIGELATVTQDVKTFANLCWPKLRRQGYFPGH